MFPRLHVKQQGNLAIRPCLYIHLLPTCSTSTLQVCFGWPNSVILTSFNLFGGACKRGKLSQTWTWTTLEWSICKESFWIHNHHHIHMCYRMYFGNTVCMSIMACIWSFEESLLSWSLWIVWLQQKTLEFGLPASTLLLCVLSVSHMAVVKLDLFDAVTHEHFMVCLVPIQDAAHRTWTLLR